MLGAIIGDIVGSVYEFANIKTKNFDFFSNRGSFTDDTILTIATADWQCLPQPLWRLWHALCTMAGASRPQGRLQSLQQLRQWLGHASQSCRLGI